MVEMREKGCIRSKLVPKGAEATNTEETKQQGRTSFPIHIGHNTCFQTPKTRIQKPLTRKTRLCF